MVFTAVLAAIAVIAAMVHVPGAEAQDGETEYTSVTPNKDFSLSYPATGTSQWGSLVWAGSPDGKDNKPGKIKNVGWAWCIDPTAKVPMDTSLSYDRDKAGKAPIKAEYRDSAIHVATLMRQAIRDGDKAKVANYSYYLAALIGYVGNGAGGPAIEARKQILNPTITGDGSESFAFKGFKGSLEEFTAVSGFTIEQGKNTEDMKLVRVPSVEIPKAPESAYITIIAPNQRFDGRKTDNSQRVFPPDQPGLPDNPDNGGGSEEPTTSPENPDTEENTTEETTSENPEEETSSSETTTDSEPSNTEETTPKDSTTEPTSPDETTKVTEPTAPVPGTEEQEKDLNPEIKTEASFDGDKQQVVAGATVKDKVHYEGLVSGKRYTLKAELRNKAADANGDHAILGTGSKTFEATGESGDVEVMIDVDKQLEKPVAAAVAFEKLYSHEVDKNGKDAPTDSEDGNLIKTHEDIDDEAQTVNTKWNPEIRTEAKFKDGNCVEKGATVIDTVTYKDLVPGKKYTLKAKLISKADGKTVLGEGSEDLVPEESAGEKDVEITVNDKADPAVDAAVAFEKLVSTEVDKDGNETTGSTDENEIATHEDINDEKQTVKTTEWNPTIKTNADFDNAKQVKAGVTVKDTVKYTDLVPGKEYTLKAELRNKAVNDEGDHEVVGKGEVTFTPKKSAGEQVVDIKVNDDVEDVIKAAVAYEDLYSKQVDENGKETPNSDEEKKITEHRDINDEAQTVTSKMEPTIGTKAEKTEGDEIKAGTVITDTVEYNDLVPGKEYTLNAELRSKVKDETTGDFPVIGHGEKTFEPSASKGEVEVKITVDEGVTEAVDEAVAFEYLTSTAVNREGEDSTTGEKNDIAEHTDIEDKDQTVKSDKPSETTTPSTTTTDVVPGEPGDGGEGETSTPSSSEDSSTPKTSETCESEEPGDSESEKPSESEEPSESESSEPSESESVETTSSEASETSESDRPSDCESTTPDKPTEPSESTEPNEPGTPGDDEKDTPKISTNADFENGSNEVIAGAKVNDTVEFHNLVPGKEYTLNAELISKVDGKSVLGSGEKTFTPETADGEVVVEIVVNDDVKEPVQAAVAFEELTSTEVNDKGEDTPDTTPENPNHIADHKDINDKDQTVTSKPRISTNADFANGSKEVVAGATVIDTVDYFNLIPGKEYKLNAELISKEDGKTVLGKGEATVKPESANGQAKVEITVSDDVKEPVEAAVAFETLTSTQVDKHGENNPTDEDNPNPIGEHKDINDDDQTVTSEDSEKTPKITTNADFEKGSHAVIAGAKIVDEVSYEGLVPGKEYTLKAELINKKDGKSVLGTGEATFTPKKSKGMEPVTITVNDDVKEPVQAAVAFEELTSTEVNDKGEDTPDVTSENPNHIAEHKDINDEDQTVTSHEVHDQDTPGGSSDGSSNGSSKDNKWWLILIPGIGLGKIIKDHFDHKDHGNHNGGHGDNTSSHNGGHGDNTGNHNGGNGHEDKGQDAPQGGNSDNGHGRSVEVQGQQPEETGNALPSNADRVEIKSVPSGATELEPGMQDYIK